MKFLVPTFIILVLMGTVAGCRRSSGHIDNWGWTLTDPDFDSLTLRLEYAYEGRLPMETLRAMSDTMDALAAADAGSVPKAVRALYWRGRLSLRAGDYDRAKLIFDSALACNDSVRYPYETARIRWNSDWEFHPYDEDTYFLRMDQLEFYRARGDLMLQAGTAMEIGTLLSRLGSYRMGMEYYELADSLLEVLGFDHEKRYNRINHAVALHLDNRDDEAVTLLREIVSEPDFTASDGDAYSIAWGDIYSFSDDEEALRRAYYAVREDTNQLAAQCSYQAFMGEQKRLAGDLDSALWYNDRALEKRAVADDPEVERDIFLYRAFLLNDLGRPREAYANLWQAKNIGDSLVKESAREQVLNIETMRAIGEKELLIEHDNARRTLVLVGIIVLVVLGGIATGVFFFRRSKRQQLARMQADLELERSQRRVLAMQLALQEKQNLVSEVGREVASMASKGEVTAAAAGKIESSIRIHNGIEPERAGFIESFSEMHPDFGTDLRAAFPSLTDADVRLATYVALGLDNRHIGRILGIRPESVKQARWRLRRRMALDAETDLAAALGAFIR